MSRTVIAALLTAATLALAGCSGGSAEPAKADAKAKTGSSTAAAPKKLEPVWVPKLDKAAGPDAEAVAACQQPSSNACARYTEDIMSVVSGLEAAIEKSGRKYPATTKQIGKMKDAESEYTDNGCQGDVTAEDPNSLCHGVVGVTMGAAILSMTLPTDEAAL